MNPNDLPFDAGAMLAGLRTWVECESPTFDAAAVNRMMGLAARDLAIMGARIEVIPGRMGFGDCVRARFAHPNVSEPGISHPRPHGHGASGRHAERPSLAPGRHAMLRTGHPGHEGRQLSGAGGGAAVDARRRQRQHPYNKFL